MVKGTTGWTFTDLKGVLIKKVSSILCYNGYYPFFHTHHYHLSSDFFFIKIIYKWNSNHIGYYLHLLTGLFSVFRELFCHITMENSTDVWNDFLRDTNKDESKKETNLIVLGEICFKFIFIM